jgi:hypothetical protein
MYDLSERISCSDGTCTGIINERGVCNICGKPLKGWQEREEQKKIEKDKREEEIEEGKNTEIQKKEEKIDIKNLLQKEIEKRIKERVEKKSQDQGARLLEPVVLAVNQLKSELSNNKQIGFRISDHHVEIHLGKERKVKVEVFRHGAGHKFHAVEEVEYEHPEHQVPNRDLIFETSGETTNFLVKVCAEFIVSQNE